MHASPEGRAPGSWKYLTPVIAYSAFIFVMSSLSAPPTPTFGLDWGDKITHAGAYLLMMLFAFRGARWCFPRWSIAALLMIALVYTSAFGASDEFHQSLVPNRQCDLYDWLADTAGAVIGAAFIAATVRLRIMRVLYGPAHEAREGR